MTIAELKLEIENRMPNNRLRVVKIINDLRGGGLLRSKEIMDEARDSKTPSLVILNILRTEEDWKLIKKNLRNYKI